MRVLKRKASSDLQPRILANSDNFGSSQLGTVKTVAMTVGITSYFPSPTNRSYVLFWRNAK